MRSENEESKKELDGFESLRILLEMKAECQKTARVEKQKEMEGNEIESHMPDELIHLTRDDRKSRDDKK